ncbi:MAG: PqqD family protein [Fibrobacter sp.]|nr:PqqD family protein [Fibrobacter sp.]
MKLNKQFVRQELGDHHVAVSPEFQAIISNNDTADFIFGQLMQETTEEKVVDAMCQEYDAPRELLAADVHEIIEQLRSQGLLQE